MKIKKLFIANRGEIAVRIIRTAKELGLRTVQAYSEADADSLAVKMADESVCIGGSRVSDSYLNIENILTAATKTAVDAIHPGYGFLAENPEFSDMVIHAGFIFIGPNGDTIRKMGDKLQAIKFAKKIGIPVIPDCSFLLNEVKGVDNNRFSQHFPVMIKASAGGGGRGMRLAYYFEQLKESVLTARAEAKSAFGNDELYIEKAILNAHHFEVQILGDGKNSVHVFDRQCSLQRRRQKIWEEAPIYGVSNSVRKQMREEAVHLAQAVGYQGAGTVEFLYDIDTGRFYFIEMNTRIQVEHPVTEMITGVDLIKEMIRISGGESLRFKQENIQKKGHAIEIRINAEDPANDFMPFPGKIDSMQIPNGPGIRFDTMIFPGYQIPPFYDSLIGKLVVWDEDRAAALSRLKRAITELKISGLKTTIPLFQALVEHEDISAYKFNTNWLENQMTGILNYK